MKKKKFPDTIISTQVAGFPRYVLNAAFKPADNKRVPTLTDDPSKARKYWDEDEANRAITRFHNPQKRVYTPEKAPDYQKANY